MISKILNIVLGIVILLLGYLYILDESKIKSKDNLIKSYKKEYIRANIELQECINDNNYLRSREILKENKVIREINTDDKNTSKKYSYRKQSIIF